MGEKLKPTGLAIKPILTVSTVVGILSFLAATHGYYSAIDGMIGEKVHVAVKTTVEKAVHDSVWNVTLEQTQIQADLKAVEKDLTTAKEREAEISKRLDGIQDLVNQRLSALSVEIGVANERSGQILKRLEGLEK